MADETTPPTPRTPVTWSPEELAPADYCDPVIEFYKAKVDREALRENLKLTVEQRLEKAMLRHKAIDEAREAAERKKHPEAGKSQGG